MAEIPLQVINSPLSERIGVCTMRFSKRLLFTNWNNALLLLNIYC